MNASNGSKSIAATATRFTTTSEVLRDPYVKNTGGQIVAIGGAAVTYASGYQLAASGGEIRLSGLHDPSTFYGICDSGQSSTVVWIGARE